ncbi:MAG: alpha-galactosidase, partial [Mycetocola sp.]
SAIATAKDLRASIASGDPHWPLGLPEWTDPWVALSLRGEDDDLVSIWRRDGTDSAVLRFPHLVGRTVEVATVFPLTLPAWRTEWDAQNGTLTVHANDAPIAARTLRLTASTPSRT